jgi:hypothetical protein
MCNRYANRVSYRGYVEEFSETLLLLLLSPLPDRAPNIEPRDNIFPTEPAPVLLGGPVDAVMGPHRATTLEETRPGCQLRCRPITASTGPPSPTRVARFWRSCVVPGMRPPSFHPSHAIEDCSACHLEAHWGACKMVGTHAAAAVSMF